MKKLFLFFLIISFNALTQEVAEDIEEVIAVGQKAGLKSALKKQQDSDSVISCLLYTSPSPRDATLSRMPSSA